MRAWSYDGIMQQKAIAQAASLFAAARRSGKLIGALPAAAKPANADDADAIQVATVAALGEKIAGWKVGLPVDGQLFRGAIMGSVIFDSPARIPAKLAPMLGVEAEIAFRFDRDLPPAKRDYTRDEVAAAVTAFPAIEVVATRFADYAATPVLDRAADCVSNGAFVRGKPVADWRKHDLSKIEVVLAIGGKEIVRRLGGHGAGDPILPAVALVNHFRHGAGVKAGQVMTTGTYTGLNIAKPDQIVVATFTGFGSAEARFTP
jgi:2-keto-4-pentenoate hydratase